MQATGEKLYLLPCLFWTYCYSLGLCKQKRRRRLMRTSQKKGLISKTMTLHLRDFGTFLCCPLQNNNVKWPNSKVLCRTWTHDSEFSFFYLNCNAVLTESAPGLFGYIYRLNELKLSRTSLKYLEVIFKVTFSLALSLHKLPFQFTTAPRKRNESSRKAMHLKLTSSVWASRQFQFGRNDVTNTRPGS